MPTAIASLDLVTMPAHVAFQRWALFRGLEREAADTNLELIDQVAGRHVAWRIRDLRRRSGLATFEALPAGGTRVYLQMASGDEGDRRTSLARMTKELDRQLVAFKAFAESLGRGRGLRPRSGMMSRGFRLVDRPREAGAA